VRSLNCSSVLISLCFFSSIFVPFAFASVQRLVPPVFCSSVQCAHLFPSVCINFSFVRFPLVRVGPVSTEKRWLLCCYSWCMITVRKGISEGWCLLGLTVRKGTGSGGDGGDGWGRWCKCGLRGWE
jgi:hypothetical protein